MLKNNPNFNIKTTFEKLFKSRPVLIEAPGRINLIGEHTDYNDGFVLPAAIDMKATFAMAPNNENVFRFYAADLDQKYDTKKIESAPSDYDWANYLLGVLAQFEKNGVELQGIDCVFESNIPIGSGLSSSAAIECGFAFGLNEIYNSGFSNYQLVKMAQKAEHEYAGVMCGIMDQFACVFGKKGEVFRLDCRDHSYEYFPFEMDDYIIALCDTGIRHELASSEYNLRRQECEKGVAILQKTDPKITALRDADESIMTKYKDHFDPLTYKRCLYVVHENERVLKACEALENNDLGTFGKLMYQSHEGLQYDYEVSCKELDILVDLTREMEAVPGSRMMGGGFGGCTINLVNRSFVKEFEEKIISDYFRITGRQANIYFANISDGVRIMS